MSTINAEIEHRVSAFVSELSALVREAAVKAVADVLGSPKRGPGRPAGSVAAPTAKPARAVKKGGHRTPGQISNDVDAVYGYIKSKPNSRSEHIRAALKMPRTVMLDSLDRLRAAKKIKMKGVKRAATYTVA